MLLEAQAKASFGQHTSKRGLAHFQGIAPHGADYHHGVARQPSGGRAPQVVLGCAASGRGRGRLGVRNSSGTHNIDVEPAASCSSITASGAPISFKKSITSCLVGALHWNVPGGAGQCVASWPSTVRWCPAAQTRTQALTQMDEAGTVVSRWCSRMVRPMSIASSTVPPSLFKTTVLILRPLFTAAKNATLSPHRIGPVRTSRSLS